MKDMKWKFFQNFKRLDKIFFFLILRIIQEDSCVDFLIKDFWIYFRDVFYFLILDNWYNNIGGCDRRVNLRGDNR